MTDPGVKPIDHDVIRMRALLALTFALARYVPLPFLDDVVRDRIGRAVVARAGTAQKVTLTPEETAALGGSPFGCLGCLGSLVWLPVKIVLYPIRTFLSLFLGLRWASRDLVEIFALGRTTDRLLTDGRYPMDATPETRVAYARDARRAFDTARGGLDLHAVQGLLALALGPLRSVLPMAVRSMRRVWHGDDGTVTAPAAAEAPASRLAAALDDPRMKALFESIDQRFDAALLAERAKSR